ncbi:MAG: DUF1573 domain-containing protein [Planctomycetota bacterium]|jgi:hypothetical protein
MMGDPHASSPAGDAVHPRDAVASKPMAGPAGLARIAAAGAILLVLGVAALQMVRSGGGSTAARTAMLPASSLPPHPMATSDGAGPAVWLDPRTSLGESATTSPLAVSTDTLDFGDAAPGGTATSRLHVVNRSSAAVELTRIHPLCGCTRLLSDPAPVRLEPGAVLEIPVSMEAAETPDRRRTKKLRLLVADQEPVHVSVSIRSRADDDA